MGILPWHLRAEGVLQRLIFEPIAEEMLSKDPKLTQEFEDKLKEASFAKNPRSRLMWPFERSPFYESDNGRYPVVRVE